MSRTNAVTIIMIEDDPGHARLIEKNIRRACVPNDILAFADGGSAIAHLTSPANHDGNYLILLDLNLPDMRGIEVLRTIKDDPRLRLAPVIILTTTDDENEIRQCYELGANVYVTKPLDFDGFANAVRQLGLLFTIMQVAPHV
ncbi:MAG TPA: response regulator [Microvirga sp.]|jgi:CheY-like chemotaxis protein